VNSAAPTHFVHTNTRLDTVPLVPEIQLHLAQDVYLVWERTEQQLGQSDQPPPFWAFAWAGGQALARYVLDHPQLVAGRRVLDLASGSGLVAIAAARAGAATVVANEVDRFAIAAIELNAQANDVTVIPLLGDLLDEDDDAEVVLAGDVFYERPMARRVLAFLDRAHARGAHILVGDPGRAYLPRTRFEVVATYEVPVPHTLEDSQVKRTSVLRLTAPTPATVEPAPTPV